MQSPFFRLSLFLSARINNYRNAIRIVFIIFVASLIPVYTLAKDDEPRFGAGMPTPVTMSTAQEQSMPVWIEAQGTVTPRNYVNVMPRVAGLLQSVSFKEGQTVKAGQLLANIDPRPFQIQVAQAEATLMKDQAQLDGAQTDLDKYETLLKQDSISAQQVTDQRTTVAQLKGADRKSVV